MSSPKAAMQPQHPPYPPSTAVLGGTPTKTLDDPITSIFLVLFLLGGAAHITIFQVNIRHGKRFPISAMLFVLCMARITTCTLRLVWSLHLTNIHIAIAAQVLVVAGVLLLFIINLIFAQRILRASHPRWAWAQWFSRGFKVYFASIAAILVALITCTVQSFYSLSPNTHRIDHDIQLFGATYLAVSAFLPIPLVLLALAPFKKAPNVEDFGKGHFRTKIIILLSSSFILTLGAAFRAGTAYLPRSRTDPAWYHSKACFYIFNFSIEILVVLFYAVFRVDQRFFVPDGCRGPGDYAAGYRRDGNMTTSSSIDRILSEEQVLDDQIEENLCSDVEKGNEVVETGIPPEVKPVPEAERDSEKAGESMDSGVGDVFGLQPESTIGLVLDQISEKEGNNVEAMSSPATELELEKTSDEPLQEKGSAAKTPATSFVLGKEAGESLEENHSVPAAEIVPIRNSEPEHGIEGAGDTTAVVIPALNSEPDHDQSQARGAGEGPRKQTDANEVGDVDMGGLSEK